MGKALNSVYGHEIEILQYCTKRNFLVELGLPAFVRMVIEKLGYVLRHLPI